MLSLGARSSVASAQRIASRCQWHRTSRLPASRLVGRTHCSASSSVAASSSTLAVAATATTRLGLATCCSSARCFVSTPAAWVVAKRAQFLWNHQQHWQHKLQQQAHAKATSRFHCLALSTALTAQQQRSISIEEFVEKLLKAYRMLKHLCKLVVLTSPLVVAFPVVQLVKDWKPEVENWWWNYALFAAQHSSPTFMKFLQWASARRDMFPAEFCDRFESFHENAPKHSWPKTEEALTMAFGDKWRDQFDIDPEPIGSGCIAQVYRARLKSSNSEKDGQEVAIKVIHPHVKQMIQFDLVFMKYCVSAMVTLFPSLKTLSMRDSLMEFAGIMNRQVNLRTEAENLKQFAQHFGEDDAKKRSKNGGKYNEEYQQQQHSYDEHPVRFPVPLMEYTTESILVETLENGMHFQEFLHKVDVKEKKKIARLLLESYLRMLFLHNFAHGDLHPGNLLFESQLNEKNGKLKVNQVVLVDAGIVTSLDRDDLNNFVELLHAVATGNGYRAGELIVTRNRQNHQVFGDTAEKTELGKRVVKGSADLKATSHSVGYMDAIMGPKQAYQNGAKAVVDDDDLAAAEAAAAAMTESERHKDSFCRGVERIVSKALQWNLRLSHVHVGSLLRDVMELCCAHNVRLEGKYASIVVSIGVLEAVGKRVDPDIDLLSIALPILIESQWKYIKQRKLDGKC